MEVNEMLGFIIAVIGIVLLGFFGVKLYGFFVDADMKNAQAFIDDFVGKIKTLNDGESNSFALRGVEGWILVAWNKENPIALEGEVIGKDSKPQKCFDKDNCLCICENSIENCQDVGYCRAVDGAIKIISKLEYTAGNDEGVYTARINSSCIPQNNQLMEFFVDKKSNNILISHDYGVRESQWVSENKASGQKLEGLELFTNQYGIVGKLEGSCLLSEEVVSRG